MDHNFETDEEVVDRDFITEDTWAMCKNSPDVRTIFANEGRRQFQQVQYRFNLKQNLGFAKPSSTDDLRIVVTGKTGVGKSATANTIIGNTLFKDDVTATAVTFKSICVTEEISGRTVSVIDTPGLQDPKRSHADILREISRVMKIFHDGVHVFVYVMNIASPRFTAEDERCLAAIEAKFGDGMKKYRLLVYTHGESLPDEMNIETFCAKQKRDNPAITRFIDELGDNIVVVNNKCKLPVERKRNQNVILALIDKIYLNNKKKVYTNEMFEKAKEERRIQRDMFAGKGYNLTLIDTVETVVALNPDITEVTGMIIRAVKQKLEDEVKAQEEKIKAIKQVTITDDISRMKAEAKQESERMRKRQGILDEESMEAEKKLKEAAAVLESADIEEQTEEIGKSHSRILNALQDIVKSFWNYFGFDS